MKGVEIVLDGLTKRYAGQAVVDQVSATIAAGSFFSLLGPSGSGKTTTLMMIAGLAAPDAGRVLLDGRDITELTPQQRGLGMVFQNYALFPHLSVEQNVAFPLRVRRLKPAQIRDQVRWALDVVRLSELAARRPAQLSGGQQQRVALARAIVYEPDVVLMDEPLGALDKNLRTRMQAEIKDIQQRLGITVVYVTHDQEEAMNMSDAIAIMGEGRIAQMGSARAVYEHPVNRFVARFLGEANLLSAESVPGYEGDAGAAVFVRPERVRLYPADHPLDADCYHISGAVTRVAFLGHLVRYGVATRAGQLTVDAPNTGDVPVFETGRAVVAQWRRADARLLTDEPT